MSQQQTRVEKEKNLQQHCNDNGNKKNKNQRNNVFEETITSGKLLPIYLAKVAKYLLT
jgi:hypothetical protein